ncbi:MAG TPA: MarR family transcriptional regulator [Ktedonosporobacter sp.]|nr:MarR family transcriptional regulator [Ktedonosporobacter sp.]
MDVDQNYRVFQELFVLLDDGDRQMLRAFNLTPLQYHALLLLGPHEGWRLTDLSERLLCERSTITRLVDFLEGEGLVSRIADAEDRRSQRVLLTTKGVLLRDQARIAHEASLQQRFDCLSEAEQQQLHQLHQKLLRALHAQKEGPDSL